MNVFTQHAGLLPGAHGPQPVHGSILEPQQRIACMPEKIDADTWIYTVITNPGSNEQVLGQHDAEANISYIPIFKEKEHATQGLLNLEVDRGTRCEVQAVLYGDIAEAADKNNFLVYLLDASGNVLNKMAPTPPKQSK